MAYSMVVNFRALACLAMVFTVKAQMLLSDFHTDHAQHHSTEALLDRAKALHEVGMKKESLAILDAISSRQDEENDEYDSTF